MRSTARTAAAAAAGAVALAVALGGGGPVAAAVPAAHSKPAQASGHGHGHGGQGSHGASADQALRQLLRQIAQADARLAHTVRDSRTARLDADAKAALLANVDADRQALTDLAASLQAPDATVDLDAVQSSLRELHPENYTEAANFLRKAARLAAAIADATAAVEGDPAAPVDALAAAQASLDSAVAKALLVTASSSRDDLRGVQTDLSAAEDSLGTVLDYLDGSDQTGVDDGSDDGSDDGTDDGSDDPIQDPTVP